MATAPWMRRGVVIPLAFVGWTLFVWGGRIRNLVREPGPLADADRWSLVASLAFVALAGAVAVALLAGLVARRSGPARPLVRALVAGLAGSTVVVWAVRGVDIALGGHTAGFIAVHLLLAVVSIGLAIAAHRALRRPGAPPSATDGSAPGRLPSKRWVSL